MSRSSPNRTSQFLLNKTTDLGLSDNALARAIDVTPQAINNCRQQGAHMSDTTCLSVAALVGAQAQITLILLHADRTPDPEAARLLDAAARVLQTCYRIAWTNPDGEWQEIRLLMPVPSKLNLAPKRPPRRKPAAQRKASRRRGSCS